MTRADAMKSHLCCCMRADCPDTECEGRQMARLQQCDGGVRLHTDYDSLLPADPPTEPARGALIPLVARAIALLLALFVLFGWRLA